MSSDLAARPAVELPMPATTPPVGHLGRWGTDPLALLREGAALGPAFGLRLWRRAAVGYLPDFNRLVLGDLDTFRSRRSLSQLSPYLAAGVVAIDPPDHRARRKVLNPSFHRQAVARFAPRFAELAAAALPTGTFDAGPWASALIRRMMAAAFLSPGFPEPVLRSFLAPLDQKMPGPLLRRPIRIRRMENALRRLFTAAPDDSLAAFFADLPDGVREARVAIAAAYDTTAHTLAFGLWELAGHPEYNDDAAVANVVSETLRMYPAGWIGSRVAAREAEYRDHRIPAGRLVLYSPYLTHRHPDLWPEPERFRPERFDEPLPAWGYIPFSAGERTCLGASLATLMLRAAIGAFAGSGLARTEPGDGSAPRGGLTLTPGGPLMLTRTGRT